MAATESRTGPCAARRHAQVPLSRDEVMGRARWSPLALLVALRGALGAPAWEELGCFPKDVLPTRVYNSGTNSNDRCKSQCQAAGYTAAGTQEESDCYCGQVADVRNNDFGKKRVQSSLCRSKCSGSPFFNPDNSCGDAFSVLPPKLGRVRVFVLVEPEAAFVDAGCMEWVPLFFRYYRYNDADLLNPAADELSPATCAKECRLIGHGVSVLRTSRTLTGIGRLTNCYCTTLAEFLPYKEELAVPAGPCDHACPAGGGSCGKADSQRYASVRYQAATSSVTVPDEYWQFVGCFKYMAQNGNTRLSGPEMDDPVGMSHQVCTDYCSSHGKRAAAIAQQRYCRCGTVEEAGQQNYAGLGNAGLREPEDTDCRQPCPGAKGEPCGAADAKPNLYFYYGKRPKKWTNLGCFESLPAMDPWFRARSTPIIGPFSKTSVKDCGWECRLLGFTASITTSSHYCFCSDQRKVVGVLDVAKVPDSFCDEPCEGVPEDKCGSADARFGVIAMQEFLEPVQLAPGDRWVKVGCYQTTSAGYIFPHKTSLSSAVNAASCQQACDQDRYVIAATNNGGECRCGTREGLLAANGTEQNRRHEVFTLDDSDQGIFVGSNCNRECDGGATGRYQEPCGGSGSGGYHYVSAKIPVLLQFTSRGCYSFSAELRDGSFRRWKGDQTGNEATSAAS